VIREAILHTGGYPDIYLKDRKTLVLSLRTSRKDILKCKVLYWSRTTPERKREALMECVLRDERYDYYHVELAFSKVARYQKYYFVLEDDKEICYLTAWGIKNEKPWDGYFEFLYANGTDHIEVPEWTRGVVYYQIFPERFSNGDTGNDPAECMAWGSEPTRGNYMGGDLAGIIQKVDYLQELGIECIYLNPIFKGDFNHKYATTNYFQVDPSFGDAEVLHRLIEELHKRGIRIVLDGVFNHVGVYFEPFQDVLQNQRQSPYKDWFYITEYPVRISHHCYECVGAYKWMPKLNTANREVREFILKVMDYWIDEFKIDGWRLDVADEVDESVWLEARIRLKEKDPSIFLLGETWGSGLRLMSGNQMDAVMNYVFRDAVRDFFAFEKIDAKEFDSRINAMLAKYPEVMNQAMFLPIDSHDTERFLSDCGMDNRKYMLAAAFQMMFVGAPCVYYGDEVGIAGGNDPDCRKCMIWNEEEQDQQKRKEYQALISLRKQEKCIKTGGYAVNLSEGRLYGFIRHQESSAVYVVINAGSQSKTTVIPVFYKTSYYDWMKQERVWAEDRNGQECLNDDMWNYQGTIRVTLEPYSVRLFKEAE